MKEVVTNKGLVYELTAVEHDDILTALQVAEQKFLDKELWTFAGRMKHCIDIMENPEKADYCKIAEERISKHIEKRRMNMNIKDKVLRLAMQEVPNKLIAEVLNISENSVRNMLIQEESIALDKKIDNKEIDEKLDIINKRLNDIETTVGNNNTAHIKKENYFSDLLKELRHDVEVYNSSRIEKEEKLYFDIVEVDNKRAMTKHKVDKMKDDIDTLKNKFKETPEFEKRIQSVSVYLKDSDDNDRNN